MRSFRPVCSVPVGGHGISACDDASSFVACYVVPHRALKCAHAVGFRFAKRSFAIPAIVDHAVECDHRTGSIRPTLAVRKNRATPNIIQEGENFGMGVGRDIHARCNLSQASGLERIDLILNVHFNGPGLNLESMYLGAYDRRSNEKKFVLRNAYSGLDRRTMMSTKDFEELANPFSGLPNEKLLAYALPGLQKIATGSDSGARDWLQSVLNYAEDTPEKRMLLELLAKP
jgi:hypothetical protein